MTLPLFVNVINASAKERKAMTAKCLANIEIKMKGEPFTLESLTEKLREYQQNGAIFDIDEAILIDQYLHFLNGKKETKL